MNVHRVAAGILFTAAALVAAGANVTVAGVSYLDPAGGWRYIYGGEFNPGVEGNPPGFGTTSDFMALDGTWEHHQGDRWDGHVPGDPISNPADPPGPSETVEGGPNGWSPGGAGSFTDDGVTYIRVQDPGNPEIHGWTQASGRQDTNRRVYFGHNMRQEGDLPSDTVLNDGITISFRARIPNSGPMDELYAVDENAQPVLKQWFDPVEAPKGRGALMWNSRGSINVAQNDPTNNFNLDSSIGFSLVMSTDISNFAASGRSGAILSGSGMGGLIMNNLNGGVPTGAVDSESAGTLNILEMTDDELNEWHEFWITIQSGGTGTHQVKVYKDGSLTPVTFNVTAASSGNAVYAASNAPYLEFGVSSNDEWGSFDMDFFSYKLGVITPVAAPVDDADFDNNGVVDGADFLAWQRGMGIAAGATNAQGDADGNGAVTAADLAIWKSKFGGPAVTAASSTVPEPATSAAALVMVLALSRWRRSTGVWPLA